MTKEDDGPDPLSAARVARFGMGVLKQQAEDEAEACKQKAEAAELRAVEARYEGKAQVWGKIAHILTTIESHVWAEETEYVTQVYEDVAEALEDSADAVKDSQEARTT